MQTLIVDSSVEISERLKQLIAESGASKTIYTALSYSEAFEIVNKVKPDAVVLDINLPRNQSFEILAKLKKTDPDILVIVLSIHIDAHTKHKCMALGADYFFDIYNEFEKIPFILKLRRKG